MKKYCFPLFHLFGIVALITTITTFYALQPKIETATVNISNIKPFLGEQWFGLWLKNQRVGYLKTNTLRRYHYYRLFHDLVLRLNLMGTVTEVRSKFQAELDKDFYLRTFHYDLITNYARTEISGTVRLNHVKLTIKGIAGQSEKLFSLPERPRILLSLPLFFTQKNIKKGKSFIYRYYEPMSMSMKQVKVVYDGLEKFPFQGEWIDAYKIIQDVEGLKLRGWITRDGSVLKEELPMGIIAIIETKEEAFSPFSKREKIDKSVSTIDVISEMAVITKGPAIDPPKLKYLELKVSGIDPKLFKINPDRQTFRNGRLTLQREDIDSAAPKGEAESLLKYKQATPFIQKDDPKIRAAANSITRGTLTDFEKIGRVKYWVWETLEKINVPGLPNALDTLQTKKGDCKQHAVLFAALARSLGFPAKIVVGLVYLRGKFYYHAWNEVFLGGWKSVDPTFNQLPADVSHIALIEGEIDQYSKLLSLLGNVRIEILKYR